MNGQSDSTDGRNNIYDEMIDDLCEADGSDRLECAPSPACSPLSIQFCHR
jgi:hypothetical protein